VIRINKPLSIWNPENYTNSAVFISSKVVCNEQQAWVGKHLFDSKWKRYLPSF